MYPDLCTCGSGRVFARCHGDPTNEFARVQALAEARQIALLFPSVRVRSPVTLARAERVAQDLGETEEASEAVLADLVGTVGEVETRRLVDAWTSIYPDRWASLCHAADDVAAAERELVTGAVAAAVHERLPTPKEILVELELVGSTPLPALAFVLPPQFLWSYDEARAAAVALPAGIEQVAAALGRFEHVERLRGLAALVGKELPFGGFPDASEALLEACRQVAHDDGFAREVLALSLLAYARELALAHTPSRN